jgi:hypothetical protein
MNDYGKGLANLQRALRIARKALRSDRAYRAALAAEFERDWLHWCKAQNRVLDSIISASNGLKRRRRRRRRRRTGDLDSEQFRSAPWTYLRPGGRLMMR